MLPRRLRPINKRFINPTISRLAGLPFGPFAVIRHVGRRSGKIYETIIMVEPMGSRLIIALTYGENVDWYRNVQAAGMAMLYWHGRIYQLEQPETLEVQEALRYYPVFQKLILKIIGVLNFVSMNYRLESYFSEAAGTKT